MLTELAHLSLHKRLRTAFSSAEDRLSTFAMLPS